MDVVYNLLLNFDDMKKKHRTYTANAYHICFYMMTFCIPGNTSHNMASDILKSTSQTLAKIVYQSLLCVCHNIIK